MTSRVNREFLALCGASHVTGSAFTPRHQGLVEQGHQTVMTHHLLLLNEVCRAFPQEWAALVPALEYLCETAPREPHGLSAFDLTQGYALASDTDRRLVPFTIPGSQPETDVARKLFDNFREMYGIFARMTAHDAEKKQAELNRKRNVRVFEKGETVFRKKPMFARPPKHLMGDQTTGPYIVADQKTLSSVVLRDPTTGRLLDEGANIPLDQILAGPRRARLTFPVDEESEVRGISQMLRREGAPPPGRVGLKGVGRRKGWPGLGAGAHVAYQTAAAAPEQRI